MNKSEIMLERYSDDPQILNEYNDVKISDEKFAGLKDIYANRQLNTESPSDNSASE